MWSNVKNGRESLVLCSQSGDAKRVERPFFFILLSNCTRTGGH